MPRTANKLTAARVKSLSKTGLYADGNGLYLQVRPNSKSWVFRYMINKRSRTMGLGPVDLVTLAEARDEALSAKRLVRSGVDPISHRQQEKAKSSTPTFSEASAKYIDSQKPGWRNAKHASQWTNTLETYADPVVGSMPVSDIATEHIIEILQPIWQAKSETASRVRGRIERILDWAKSLGYREGENPARWKGHLEHSLPPLSRIKHVRHHRALPWQELPDFMTELSSYKGLAGSALQLTILTAARTSEVRRANWSEFDLESDVPQWTIPADRMKAGREHRIPLSAAVVELLNSLPVFDSGLLFESHTGKPMSESGMLGVLRRLSRRDITVHGFRSTFRDWCAEQTSFPREIAEAALAHINRDRVEAAYLRSDLLAKRHQLMEQWALFATSAVEGQTS